MRMKTILFMPAAVLTLTAAVWAAEAKVDIRGTAENSPIRGEASLQETAGGLKLTAWVQGVSAGNHGFHIHEKGDCGEQAMNAGGHYNPLGVAHGLVTQDGPSHAHAGDMGNIEVAADGTGRIETFLPGLSIKEGEHTVQGRALILHEKEDDFSQPTGNAGGRIACGIIEEI